MTPYKLGLIAAVAAAGMILVQLAGYEWFLVRIGSFVLPLWVLAALYAGLQFLQWHLTKKKLVLSDAEVAQWGDKLEQATPAILRLYGQHLPVKQVAAEVETSHGIPPDVTLRYIIALAQHAQQAGALSDNGTSRGETP